MNVNTNVNKVTAIVVPVMLFALYTLFFAILEKTPVSITAYVCGIFAAVLFAAANLYFINAQSGYPWVAAIPMTMWRYVITSTILSAVFVIADAFIPVFDIPNIILIIGQILVFAFFFTMLLLMHTGKQYIEDTDKKVAGNTEFIRGLTLELNAVKRVNPAKEIAALADSVRYSDPMSIAQTADTEREIGFKCSQLKTADGASVPGLCAEITNLLKDRNDMLKTYKRG